MPFCTVCHRVMRQDTSTGAMIFVCVCENKKISSPDEACVLSKMSTSNASIDMYRGIIKTAADDVTNRKIMQDCPKCGLDYLTQLQITETVITVRVCDCGYVQ